MPEFHDACATLAQLVEGYRHGDLAPPDAAHVARWASQFPAAVRFPIVAEMTNVLSKSYFSKEKVIDFLDRVATSKNLCGDDPASFWMRTQILHLQTVGNSQRELLELFESRLEALTGLSFADCGKAPQRYLYLDDGLFSGGRIKSDLIGWINGAAPAATEVTIVVIACHSQGAFFLKKDLGEAAKAAGKTISFNIRYSMQIIDKLFNDTATDVLRPTGAGEDAGVQAYVADLGKVQQWRTVTQPGPCGFYTGEAGRVLLEQEFLREGVGIRANSPHLNVYQRPLGNTTMRTTGFGTPFVTWRNCPNNAPLVLWAGDPWYPLFRRITN